MLHKPNSDSPPAGSKCSKGDVIAAKVDEIAALKQREQSASCKIN
jgi:hypothetical protein